MAKTALDKLLGRYPADVQNGGAEREAVMIKLTIRKVRQFARRHAAGARCAGV
jgi:hypothetical protein